MKINSKILRTVFLLLLIEGNISGQNISTKGTEFWMCFMENLDLQFNGAPKFSFFISSDVNTTGVISMPATGFTLSFNATGGQVTEVFLPNSVFYPVGSENIEKKGIVITTADPVNIGAQHHRAFFSEATMLLPITELDHSYEVITFLDDKNNPGQMSEFIVVATDNNTLVEITPSSVTRMAKPAGVPFLVMLQKGEVYQVQSAGELTGSIIKTDPGKKIAVFAGANTANVICGANSHLYDQTYPLSRWGTKYVLDPFTPGYYDKFRILAQRDSTPVYFGCTNPKILNKGQHFDTLLNSSVIVSSVKPFSVGQFKAGQLCSSLGDCTFLSCPPLTFASHKSVFKCLQNSALLGTDPQFTSHFVNIVVPTANTAMVTLDNLPVTFTPVNSNTVYSQAHVSLNGGTTHTLLSGAGFYANLAGYGNYDTYSYFLGYDDKINTETNFNIQSPDSLCKNQQGEFAVTGSFIASTLQWNFGNNQTSTLPGPAIAYSDTGYYNVTLFMLDPSGCAHTSEKELLVYSCDINTITPIKDCEVFIPTAFSPNNNGSNDLACVYGNCVKEIDLKIYDRWGEVVFRSNDQKICWDGTFKGEKLNNGVFVYTLKATLNSGEEIIKKGNISIVK